MALEQRNRQLELLTRASRQLNAVLEIPVVLRRLIAGALELTGATAGGAGLMQDGRMVFNDYYQGGQWTPVDFSFPAGRGVPGWVIEHHAHYLTNDTEHDPCVVPEIRAALRFYNLLNTPILNRQGELLGCFELHNKPGGFDDTDLLLLQGLAASAAIALENTAILAGQKQTQAALRQSHSLLEAALESTADGILVVDVDQRVSACNRKFLEMWRIPPDLAARRDDQ